MEVDFSDAKDAIKITATTKSNLPEACAKLGEFGRNFVESTGFQAGLGEITQIPNETGKISQVLFGLGDENARSRSRLHFGKLATSLPEGDYEIVDFGGQDETQATLAWLLASYQFDAYKAKQKTFPRLVASPSIAKDKLLEIARAAHLAMELINQPANVMTPSRLQSEVANLANRHGAALNVVSGKDLEAEFPLIHAVGRASADAPRLLDLSWGDESAPKVTLVGKGVCFDTGGLDLKPSSSMLLMKKDMGGAANAIALAQMIIARKLPVRLRLLIPAVENSVASNSFRPGDILTARNGQTIEINNTDAEGRLVLADALSLASEESPDLLISLATLTGAARVALGPDVMPYYCDDDDLAERLMKSSLETEDPLWRMPFWNPYEEMIEPANAMLDNAPSGGFAGSITAALFLRRFASQCLYAHFDIFGWTPTIKPGRPFGGSAQAIRALFAAIEAKYG